MVKLGDANCDLIELTANITDHAGTCIDNPAGFYGKVFDCKGHTIDGDQTGLDFGVYLGGGTIKNLNTIKNCTITGFYRNLPRLGRGFKYHYRQQHLLKRQGY